ncbi:MAG: Gfo/Idh/MocA family oxidoreductase [Pirellulales bacterium]|nr:Gfo/Idh/MocA family oxidoreductase [Pirellulales bacterium]
MNLTPEERAIGIENFRAAVGSKLLRRDFLQKSVQQELASGRGLGPYYFGYGDSVKEPVRVGVIGTGDEGSVLLGAINPKFIQVKSIADIRPYSIHRAFHGDCYSDTALAARCGLLAKYGWKTEDEGRKNVKVYGDYRDLINSAKDDGLEGVIIALPLHLHAPAAIAAMKAGLHVLTEKLMGHSVRECKEMARVSKETGLYLITGHQRHYNVLYDNAVHMISQGLIGDIHYIRAQWHRGNLPGTDSWQQPLPQKSKPDDPQAEELVKKLKSWQGQLDKATKTKDKSLALWERRVAQVKAQIADEIVEAEKFGYEVKEIKDGAGNVVYKVPAIEELIRWRLWNRTGGGLMAELGSHQLDAASIFIAAMHEGKKQYPLSVAAAGNRPIFPPDRDVEDHVFCLYEFPAPGYNPDDPVDAMKKIGVAYASINGNGFGGYGETVFGTEGTVLLEREQEALLYRTSDTLSKIRLAKDSKNKKRPAKMEVNESGDEVSVAVSTLALQDISRGYTEEEEHWAWCIRNPDNDLPPRCHPKVAITDAVIALTTNIAAREGQRIEFKKEWFDPDRDETPDGQKPDLSRYA